MMGRVVEIRTGSRLHFGLFDTCSASDRQGGIGLMIDRPGWRLRGSCADADAILADPETSGRIEQFLVRLARMRTGSAGVRIESLSSIPAHRGFGSGTQLALAVGSLLDALEMLSSGNATAALGRGERSLVGTLGFARGGFVVDPGERPAVGNAEPRVVTVPVDWRFVIVEPLDAGQFSGEIETEAFAQLTPMNDETRTQLAKLVERKIVPGLQQRSFVDFASGIADFNRLVGKHFAPAQGGTYAHPVIRRLADFLKQTERPYLAQSSWGPAAAVFCPNEESAERLMALLENRFDGSAVTIKQAAPLSQGVEVVTF